MIETMGRLGLEYNDRGQGMLGSLVVMPSLLSRVIESQGEDTKLLSIRDQVHAGTSNEGWAIHANGSLRFRGRIVVPELEALREEILREFHYSQFFVHQGGTKIYHDLHLQYY